MSEQLIPELSYLDIKDGNKEALEELKNALTEYGFLASQITVLIQIYLQAVTHFLKNSLTYRLKKNQNMHFLKMLELEGTLHLEKRQLLVR